MVAQHRSGYWENGQKLYSLPWEPTQSAWSRIHIDFTGPINNYLLVVIDSFTKWVEVIKIKEITSAFTIKALREIFWRYGLVDTLVRDNGRQFTPEEFRNFVNKNGIYHIPTAPGHPAKKITWKNIMLLYYFFEPLFLNEF